MKDKIIGTILGVAIGDALGLPVESMSQEQIKKTFGHISKYRKAKSISRKNLPLGTYSDDTQLTLAVMNSIVRSNGVKINDLVKIHIDEYDISTAGWGGSTKGSINRLKNGEKWHTTGFHTNPNRGTGNGICMKIAPLALLYSKRGKIDPVSIARFASMTHATRIGIESGLIHVFSIKYLISENNYKINPIVFLDSLIRYINNKKELIDSFCYESDKVSIIPELLKLRLYFYDINTDIAIKLFGGGSCYVAHSLPFSYFFFLKYQNFKSVIEVINAGGDTDTNGSLVGSLLGSLRGKNIFPEYFINNLDQIGRINNTIDNFCNYLTQEKNGV